MLVALFACTYALQPSAVQARADTVNISSLIEMLVALNIIPEDKADLAREYAAGQEEDEDGEDTSSDTETGNLCAYGQFKNALQLGSQGDEVTQLQEFLASDLSIYPEGQITGYFGPLTEKAVKRYQEKYGIDQVGIVGPQTRSMMQEQYHNCIALRKQEQEQKREQLNKSDDEEETDDNEDADEDTNEDSIEITLQVEDEDEATITWESSEPSKKGFRVVWSMDENPTYPTRDGDKSLLSYSKDGGGRTLYAFDGPGTYYVRVCENLGSSKCGAYSNEVEIELESEYTSYVDAIDLEVGNSNNEVEWETDGTAKKGFKVVWSMDENPTYPTRDSDELLSYDSSSRDDAILDAFDGAGTYYVRVCEYIGGTECGTYSNEVEIELED